MRLLDDLFGVVIDLRVRVADQQPGYPRFVQAFRQMVMQLREPGALLMPADGDCVPDAKNGGKFALFAKRPDGSFALLGFDPAGKIQRIVRSCEAGHQTAQGRRSRWRKLGQAYARNVCSIGGDFANATGIGDDAKAARAKYTRPRDDIGGCEQLFDRSDADDAELPADSIEYAIVTDQRAGVRCGRLGRNLTRANLENDDGLADLQRPLGNSQKPGRTADGLDKKSDRPSMWIIDEVVEKRARVEISLIAGRDHITEADILLIGELGEEESGCPALRHDRNAAPPGGRPDGCRPGDSIVGEVDEAEAVGTEQAYIMLARTLPELLLQIDASPACFGEARGQHHGGARAGTSEIVDRLEHRRRGNEHYPQVEGRSNGGAAFGCPLTVNHAAAPVDKMHLAAKAAQCQVVIRGARPAGLFGSADDHDGSRAQQRGNRRCIAVRARS